MTLNGKIGKEDDYMTIAGKEYEEVLILGKGDELLVSITDENVIESGTCKVVYVPKREE